MIPAATAGEQNELKENAPFRAATHSAMPAPLDTVRCHCSAIAYTLVLF